MSTFYRGLEEKPYGPNTCVDLHDSPSFWEDDSPWVIGRRKSDMKVSGKNPSSSEQSMSQKSNAPPKASDDAGSQLYILCKDCFDQLLIEQIAGHVCLVKKEYSFAGFPSFAFPADPSSSPSLTLQDRLYHFFEDSAHRRDPFQQILALERLAFLEFSEGERDVLPLKTASYLNLALCVARKHAHLVSPAYQREVLQRLALLEWHFVHKSLALQKPPHSPDNFPQPPQLQNAPLHGASLAAQRLELENIRRETAIMDLDDTSSILGCLSLRYASLLSRILTDLTHLLGQPPSVTEEFAIITFGSLARREMLPFEALGLLVLVKEKSDPLLQSIALLLDFLALRIINLGETGPLYYHHHHHHDHHHDQQQQQPTFSSSSSSSTTTTTSLSSSSSLNRIVLASNGIALGFRWVNAAPSAQALSFTCLEFIERHNGATELSITERHDLQTILHLFGSRALTTKCERLLASKCSPLRHPVTPAFPAQLLASHLLATPPKLSADTSEPLDCQLRINPFLLTSLHGVALTLGLSATNAFDIVAELKKRHYCTKPAAFHLRRLLATTLGLSCAAQLFYASDIATLFRSPSREPWLRFTLDPPRQAQLAEAFTMLSAYLRVVTHLLAGDKRAFKTALLCDPLPPGDDPAPSAPLALDAAPSLPAAPPPTPAPSPRTVRRQELTETLDLLRELYPDDEPHPDVAACLSNLALCHLSAGDCPQAITFLEQACQMQQALGQGSPTLLWADALSHLGKAYFYLKDYRRAVELYQQALDMKLALHENEHHLAIAHALLDLGCSCLGLEDFRPAIRHFERAHAIYRALFGNEPHPEIVLLLQRQASAYSGLDDHSRALGLYASAETVLQQLNVPSVDSLHAALLDDFGAEYALIANYPKALECFTQVLALNHRLYPHGAHLQLLVTAHHLAETHIALCQFAKAIELLQAALTAGDTLAPSEARRLLQATLADSLSVAHCSLGNLSKALHHGQEALALLSQAPSPSRPPTVTILRNLSEVYLLMADHPQALAKAESAAMLAQQLFGEGHVQVAHCCYLLAKIHGAMGNLEHAEEAFAEARLIYARKKLQPHLAVLLCDLGDLCRDLGNIDQAIEHHQLAYQSLHHIFGTTPHVLLVKALRSLGNDSYAMGDYARAVEYHENALSLIKGTFDQRPHHEMAETLFRLGYAYLRINQDRGMELLLSAHQMYGITLGPDHPLTLRVKEKILKT